LPVYELPGWTLRFVEPLVVAGFLLSIPVAVVESSRVLARVGRSPRSGLGVLAGICFAVAGVLLLFTGRFWQGVLLALPAGLLLSRWFPVESRYAAVAGLAGLLGSLAYYSGPVNYDPHGGVLLRLYLPLLLYGLGLVVGLGVGVGGRGGRVAGWVAGLLSGAALVLLAWFVVGSVAYRFFLPPGLVSAVLIGFVLLSVFDGLSVPLVRGVLFVVLGVAPYVGLAAVYNGFGSLPAGLVAAGVVLGAGAALLVYRGGLGVGDIAGVVVAGAAVGAGVGFDASLLAIPGFVAGLLGFRRHAAVALLALLLAGFLFYPVVGWSCGHRVVFVDSPVLHGYRRQPLAPPEPVAHAYFLFAGSLVNRTVALAAASLLANATSPSPSEASKAFRWFLASFLYLEELVKKRGFGKPLALKSLPVNDMPVIYYRGDGVGVYVDTSRLVGCKTELGVNAALSTPRGWWFRGLDALVESGARVVNESRLWGAVLYALSVKKLTGSEALSHIVYLTLLREFCMSNSTKLNVYRVVADLVPAVNGSGLPRGFEANVTVCRLPGGLVDLVGFAGVSLLLPVVAAVVEYRRRRGG